MYCKIRTLGGCICILLSFLVWGCGSKDSSNQFTAEMVETMADQSKTSKILVKGLKYRIEQETEGQPLYVLVDQNIGITRVVLPINEQYMEMKSQDRMSLMNDPFQGLKYSISIGETKELGTETVNGYVCDKSMISIQDQDIMTQWVSQKLNFPIKILNHVANNMTMELKNIQEGEFDDALFETPAEYTMMTKPSAEPEKIPGDSL